MDFNSTATFTKARIDVNSNLDRKADPIAFGSWQIQTPQRRACYSDKQRIRLKDVKSWALRRSGCKNTTEVKKYLRLLGIKLDLRLTSAWVAINKEFAFAIKLLHSQQKAKHPYKVTEMGGVEDFRAQVSIIGDRVEWTELKPRQAGLRSWLPLNNVATLDALASSLSEPVNN